MEQNNSDEIDLQSVYKGFKKIIKKWVVLFFRLLDFCLRKWIIILILLIIGAALGYFTQSSSKQKKEATVLLRINFDSVDYVYSEIELFDRKIMEHDNIFLKKVGLTPDSLEIRGLAISPIVNLKDITTNFGGNGRYLEGLLKNLEFNDKDVEISNTFTSEYKNHLLHLYLSSNATIETIEKVLNQINRNTLLEKIKDREVQNMQDRISNNNKIISQIDNVIEAYNSNESISSPSEEVFVVDKNFDIELILQKKMVLQRENERIKKDLLYSEDIVVIVNKPFITNVEKKFSNNKLTYYPIMFVGLFLLLAFMRHSYYHLREVAKNEENKH